MNQNKVENKKNSQSLFNWLLWWRLDKKELEKQVKEYIDLISAIYPEKKVKGLLLYVDELKIKEVS